MAPKYDWTNLLEEFKKGGWLTVSSFFEAKGIKDSGQSRKMTANWLQLREDYQKRLNETIEDKSIEAIAESEAQIRARQARLAKLLQTKGLQALLAKDKTTGEDVLKIDSPKIATQMIVAGLREEREALDINKKPLMAGNINIAVLNTRFGEMIQKMDYGELRAVLDRLAELDTTGEKGTVSNSPLPSGVKES